MKSLVYNTPELEKFYSSNRIEWKDFYESERNIFERVFGDKNRIGDILDAGCATGGLAQALDDKFGITNYTGIDINSQCIETARRKYSQQKKHHTLKFICGDVVSFELPKKHYENVISLSCVDWNLYPKKGLRTLWNLTEPGGNFIFSARITPGSGSYTLEKSYQLINFGEKTKGPFEKACYIVFNWSDFSSLISEFNPLAIHASGYWGLPSKTSVSPYKKLIFAVFAITKRTNDSTDAIKYLLDLPSELKPLSHE